jgi:arginine deiminase
MPATNSAFPIQVTSEIGALKRILIHRPDSGIGKIIPSKFKDWLYDDTVHLRQMQREYDEYIKLLLYFLDPDKIAEVRAYEEQHQDTPRPSSCLNPSRPEYISSDKVLDVQKVLSNLLVKTTPEGKENVARLKLISAICAIESVSFEIQQLLESLEPELLTKVLITGILPKGEHHPHQDTFIFPPLPNLIFTRDIGIVIHDHFLLSKAAKRARRRESLLTKYIAYYDFYRQDWHKVIEVSEDSAFFLLDEVDQAKNEVTLEGGDVMLVSPTHLLVGCSERTSPNAVNNLIHRLFSMEHLPVELISVVKIPPRRDQMHIDTIFTQVKKNMWVLYGKFSEVLTHARESRQTDYLEHFFHNPAYFEKERAEVFQLHRGLHEQYAPDHDYMLRTEADYIHLNTLLRQRGRLAELTKPAGIEGLLRQVSVYEFGCAPQEVIILYSGGGEFPFDDREQWTDSCNLLALREGVVIGYNRNLKTMQQFEVAYENHYRKQGVPLPEGMTKGFQVVQARDLLHRLDAGDITPADIHDTLIVLSSDELSRARGGSRCLSLPLLREPYTARG